MTEESGSWEKAFEAALSGAIGAIGTAGIAPADIVARAMAVADAAEAALKGRADAKEAEAKAKAASH